MAVQPVVNKPAAPRTPKEPDKNSFAVARTEGHTTEWDDVSGGILTPEDERRLNAHWEKHYPRHTWQRHKAEAVKILVLQKKNITSKQCEFALRAMEGMKERTCKDYLAVFRPTTRGPKSPSPGTKKYKRK